MNATTTCSWSSITSSTGRAASCSAANSPAGHGSAGFWTSSRKSRISPLRVRDRATARSGKSTGPASKKSFRPCPAGKTGSRRSSWSTRGRTCPGNSTGPSWTSASIAFFVVADQNQQITEANSSRRDIESCLAIETNEVIELSQNYRNHYQVARLAREFYTGDPASPPPEIPRPAPGTVPLLYDYEQDNLDAVARGILRLADRDPRQLIGVIAPKNSVRKRYLEALRSVEVSLDNPRPAVETYHGEHRAEVAFDQGGILVINAQACKGLEFDTVVLADIDEHFVRRRDPDVAKRLFYVMVARARERVFMFMKRNGRNDIEAILPSDQNVLRRKEL